MTTKEFSNEFEVLYNNIMSNAAPGINEYEKSLFLTKAQEELVKNYFNPLGNKYQEGFDDSRKRLIDFSELVKTGSTTDSSIIIYPGASLSFDKRAVLYQLPLNLLLILNESAETTSNGETSVKQVIPLHYEEYTRLMSKPYKEPLKFQVWRLLAKGTTNSVIISELIPKSNSVVDSYNVRYVRRPLPIILTDLASEYVDVSINGIDIVSECELNPSIHREILDRAVELAKVAYQGDLSSTIQLNQRNE